MINQIKSLEKKIKHQKQRLTQFEGIIKELRFLLKARKEEAYSDMSELINNLEDDLQLDLKNGENGYKTHKESYLAVKKYTLKLLKIKINKWNKFAKG